MLYHVCRIMCVVSCVSYHVCCIMCIISCVSYHVCRIMCVVSCVSYHVCRIMCVILCVSYYVCHNMLLKNGISQHYGSIKMSRSIKYHTWRKWRQFLKMWRIYTKKCTKYSSSLFLNLLRYLYLCSPPPPPPSHIVSNSGSALGKGED